MLRASIVQPSRRRYGRASFLNCLGVQLAGGIWVPRLVDDVGGGSYFRLDLPARLGVFEAHENTRCRKPRHSRRKKIQTPPGAT
jgi:hypothetical protein